MNDTGDNVVHWTAKAVPIAIALAALVVAGLGYLLLR